VAAREGADARGQPEEVLIMDPIDQVQKLFGIVFEPDDLVELRPLKRDGGPAAGRRWDKAAEVVAAQGWLEKTSADGHCHYFGANPRKRAAGKKEDVLVARCMFADFDGGAEVDEVMAAIENAGRPWPSAIVRSGGGVHCWWRLAEPMSDLPAWERCQKRLALDLGSDPAVCDAPRIMRLPGYVNHKYPHRPLAELVEATGQVCQLEQLLPGGIPPEPPKVEAGPVEQGSLSERSRQFLSEGWVFAPGGRRATAFSVACDMKARGWTEEAAIQTIMPAMQKLGLPAEDLRDVPRQIRNAFAQDREPLADREPAAEIAVAENPGRPLRGQPVIRVEAANRSEVTDKAEQLLREEFYVRDGRIVTVGEGLLGPTIAAATKERISDKLERLAAFVQLSKDEEGKWSSRAIPCPAWLPAVLVGKQVWPSLRELRGIARGPFIRPDGTIGGTRPGYDDATQLLVVTDEDWSGLEIDPTGEDVALAVDQLRDLLRDFPFEDGTQEVGLAVWTAALLSLLARPAYEGPSPLFLFDGRLREDAVGEAAVDHRPGGGAAPGRDAGLVCRIEKGPHCFAAPRRCPAHLRQLHDNDWQRRAGHAVDDDELPGPAAGHE
jgi:hypothetical protein